MNNYIKLFFSLVLPISIGAIAGFSTTDAISSWYVLLEKPFFNPPNWVFGPVWSILYIMIGISFFIVWKNNFGENKQLTKIIYFLQLLFNFTWSFSFFYFENPLLGLVNIIILWILVLINIIFFYKIDKKAGLILIPYLAWVTFASALNIAIYILN